MLAMPHDEKDANGKLQPSCWSTQQVQRYVTGKSTKANDTQHRAISKRKILAIGAATLLAFGILHQKVHDQSSWGDLESQASLHDAYEHRGEQRRCNASGPVRNHRYSYNFDHHKSHGLVWELHDHIPSEYHAVISTNIIFMPGVEEQTSDIEVAVEIRSIDRDALQSISVSPKMDGLVIGHTPVNRNSACVGITAVIFLRPWPWVHLDSLVVRSNISDILLGEDLNWEINQLTIHTTHGDARLHRAGWEALTLHNIDMSSVTGEIGGWFHFWDNLNLRNEKGKIKVIISADDTFRIPGEKSLTATTSSGDVDVGTTLPYRTHPAVHLGTYICTISGNIETSLLHSTYTNISSNTGNLWVSIQPHGIPVPGVANYFYTTTQEGNIRIYLTHAVIADGHFDPMRDLHGFHYTGSGNMTVDYPVDWYGHADLSIDNGTMKVLGDELEELNRNDTNVSFRRGEGSRSRMRAHVGVGSLALRVGRWWRQ